MDCYEIRKIISKFRPFHTKPPHSLLTSSSNAFLPCPALPSLTLPSPRPMRPPFTNANSVTMPSCSSPQLANSNSSGGLFSATSVYVQYKNACELLQERVRLRRWDGHHLPLQGFKTFCGDVEFGATVEVLGRSRDAYQLNGKDDAWGTGYDCYEHMAGRVRDRIGSDNAKLTVLT